jgi:crotonobetainyl-CoA:carnitine CoA-transferase CaiB-like acyl-CoA transferase
VQQLLSANLTVADNLYFAPKNRNRFCYDADHRIAAGNAYRYPMVRTKDINTPLF